MTILELHESAIPEGPGEFERNFKPVADKLVAIDNPHIPHLLYYGMSDDAAVIYHLIQPAASPAPPPAS